MNDQSKSLLGSASVDPDKVETVSHVDAMPQAAQDGGLGTQAREGEGVTVSAVCGWCDGAKVVQSQTYGHVICAHCRGSGVETYTRTVTAALYLTPPSQPLGADADKLRIAVEALEGARGPLSTAKMWGKRKGGCDGAVDKIDRALWGIKKALAALKAEGA